VERREHPLQCGDGHGPPNRLATVKPTTATVSGNFLIALVLLFLAPAVRQQSRLLSQRYDPTRPALDCFLVRSPRNPVVTGKGDQLFDMRVGVVPLLDYVRQVELASRSHYGIRERNRNSVN
jgi:hypothetical protein